MCQYGAYGSFWLRRQTFTRLQGESMDEGIQQDRPWLGGLIAMLHGLSLSIQFSFCLHEWIKSWMFLTRES
jgi:hypothetical protein